MAVIWLGIRDVFLCSCIFLLMWVPVGRWALARLDAGEYRRSLSVSASLGMGICGLVVLALGLPGLLYRNLILLLAGISYAALRLHRHTFAQAGTGVEPDGPDRSEWLWYLPLLCLSAYFLVIALSSSLAPETAFDSLNVHLPYARDAAASHRAAFEPNNWSSIMPALPLMSYITAFLFSGVGLAKLMNAACFLVCGGLAWFFGRRWLGSSPALAAALMLWACPIALYESTTAMVDLPLTVFSAVSIFALLDWTSAGRTGSFHVSATALGLALGCKFHAGFWIAPAVLIIFHHAWRSQRRSPKEAARLAGRYALIALSLYLPWMIRAYLYTGNPVFPAANGIFKSGFFPPSMMEAAAAAYANEGVGTSVGALIRLPWTLTFRPGAFRGSLGFAFLAGIVLAAARRDPRMRYGLFLSGVYFYSWALTAQEIRYLLPMVPLLALLTAYGLFGLKAAAGTGGKYAKLSRLAGMIFVLGTSAISSPLLYPKIVREWTYWHSYLPPFDYLSGKQSAQEFLRRDVPSIYAYDWINSNLKREHRILLLNDAAQFYSRVPTLYSFTVEAEGILFEESEEGILRRLEQSKITHVLLNYNGIAPIPGVAPRRGVYFFLDRGFQQRHLEPLFEQNKVTVYRVRRGPGL